MLSPTYRILLVDDDREVLMLIGSYLQQKGLNVILADSVPEALEYLNKSTFHCIVLDVMMPGTDGFEAFLHFRKMSSASILFLTGRTEDSDRIRGLLLGADDYLNKPCSPEELYLRIMINIRKQHVNYQSGVLEFPPLTIHLLQHRVYYDSTEEIALSQREFELLALLAQHANEPMTFEQIGTVLNGTYIAADRKNIMVTASRLRKKMEGYVGLEHIIETVWGTGYRFLG